MSALFGKMGVDSVHSNGELTNHLDGGAAGVSDPKKNSKKDGSRQIRVYDPDDFRRRADCFCFRDRSRAEVLLVSSRNHAGMWTIPGGGLEPRESGAMAAEREALEEAGVKGEIGYCVGVHEDMGHKTRTEVFTMTVREEVESWQDNQEKGYILVKLVTWVVSQALSALPIHRKRRCMRAGQREAGNKARKLLASLPGSCGSGVHPPLHKSLGTKLVSYLTQICRQRKWFTVENAIASIEHRKPVNCKFLRAAAADVCLSHERTADPAHPPQGGPGCSNTGSQGNDLQRHASC